MKNKEVEAFNISALQYCNLIENWNTENFKLNNLLCSLLDLYSKALCLPVVQLEQHHDQIKAYLNLVSAFNKGNEENYLNTYSQTLSAESIKKSKRGILSRS